MQAYGAVAPSSALRSSGATAQRESKSNGNTFMALVAGVIVLALVVGHQAHANSAPTTNLAAAKAMHMPVANKQMAVAHKQMAVAQMAAAPVKTQHLEEEAPPSEEAHESPAAKAAEGDDSIDLLPPKKIKGGKAKELESSIEEAFEDKPDGKNSHYIADHTDKEVHLLIIFFLLLGTLCVYYFWKSKDGK